MEKSAGKLSIVGTPIGNLADITYRAVETLKQADMILCEDTRVSKRLLQHYGIDGKQLSTWNEERSGVKIEKIFEWLEAGKNLALITDAGMPGLSDPGSRLVALIRTNEPCVLIEAVPGPSALTAAISISGLPMHEFTFLGFLPHKKGRETLFKEIAEMKRPAVFYESPHRILKSLESLEKFCPDKNVTIARELTKIHEEVENGTAAEIREFFGENPDKIRGEFVVFVHSR